MDRFPNQGYLWSSHHLQKISKVWSCQFSRKEIDLSEKLKLTIRLSWLVTWLRSRDQLLGRAFDVDIESFLSREAQTVDSESVFYETSLTRELHAETCQKTWENQNNFVKIKILTKNDLLLDILPLTVELKRCQKGYLYTDGIRNYIGQDKSVEVTLDISDWSDEKFILSKIWARFLTQEGRKPRDFYQWPDGCLILRSSHWTTYKKPFVSKEITKVLKWIITSWPPMCV